VGDPRSRQALAGQFQAPRRADTADATKHAVAAKASWSRRITVFCVASAAIGLLSPNPYLTAGGLLVLPMLFVLLWKVGEPPVLLFAAVFQWLQVFVPVLRANSRGEAVGSDASLPELGTAAWLGLIAIVVLALGMRLGRGRRSIVSQNQLKAWVAQLSPSRLLVAYFTALAFSLFALGREPFPGLRQGLLALSVLRWMAAFLVLWSAMNERRFRRGAVLVVAIEVVLGFGGFFSSFKTIIFLTTLVLLGSEQRVRLLRPGVIGLLGGGLFLMTYWQAIKVDYRSFLNAGTDAQVILVSPQQRLSFLFDRSVSLTLDEMYAALDPGLARLGYIDFFAMTIEQVPRHIPYQRGQLWGEALTHLVTPRIFFPSKEVINDSDRTNTYSGIRVAGGEAGTSVSLGYVAESYIDFGPVLMFLPICLVGVLWGWSYRWLATRGSNQLLGLSAATMVILIGAILFESSNIKLLGGAVTNILVLTALLDLWGDRLWGLLTAR